MTLIKNSFLVMLVASGIASAQSPFTVTGTAIPPSLLRQNYGKLPNDVSGYDLDICNTTETKQSIVSSEIYQALAQYNSDLHPIGRQIMLAAVLRNQNRTAGSIVSMVLNSVTGVLSVLSTSKTGTPAGVVTGVALGAVSAQQIISSLKPVLTNDQLERFESEVLEPALVLDSGSCVERTVFAAVSSPAAKTRALKFHVH